MDEHAPDRKEHRWIVAGNGIVHARDIPVLLRSTSPGWGGIPHDEHNGTCGTQNCRIDLPGWITAFKRIPKAEFSPERKSCNEPDDEIIEKVMKVANSEMKREFLPVKRRGAKKRSKGRAKTRSSR